MRFNKVDIAWYGNLSAMEAVDRANGQVFAQTVAADGSPGYWSVLIVNKDSPINNLNDLLAKRKDLSPSAMAILTPPLPLSPVTTSLPKTISPPATLAAPSTLGMKPTRWPSPAGGCCHQQHRKPRQAENLRAREAERTEGDLEMPRSRLIRSSGARISPKPPKTRSTTSL